MKKIIKVLNNEGNKFDNDKSVLFSVAHNIEKGDMLISLLGNWELFSVIFSTDKYVNLTEESKDTFIEAKKMILNTVVNMCKNDNELKHKLLKYLVEL